MVRFLTSIGRALLSVGLDFHSTSDSDVSFSSGEISDVNESVVGGSQQVHNSEVVDFGAGAVLRWTKVGLLIFLNFFNFLGALIDGKEPISKECSF